MREFEDRMQRRIFQPKKRKVVGLLQKKNIYIKRGTLSFYSSQNIGMVKLRVGVRWTAHFSYLKK
jgi:hypothetical protein